MDDGLQGRTKYTSIGNAMTTIVRSEGVRGLYRGVAPNVVTAGSSWGSYFLFYQTIKSRLQQGDSTRQLGTGDHLVAASAAGLMTLVFTNPITVVKTRSGAMESHHVINNVDILDSVYNTNLPAILTRANTTRGWWTRLSRSPSTRDLLGFTRASLRAYSVWSTGPFSLWRMRN